MDSEVHFLIVASQTHGLSAIAILLFDKLFCVPYFLRPLCLPQRHRERCMPAYMRLISSLLQGITPGTIYVADCM